MKKVLVASSAFMLLLGIAEAGSALTLSAINGTWTSVTGGTNITGLNTNVVKWGEPATSGGQSGFGFTGTTTPLTFAIDEVVDLGDFTHFNQPIWSGTAATAAQLEVGLTFSDPNGLNGVFNFTFDINETPNNTGGSADNDIITFPNSYANETVTIGGTTYTLQLLGFGPTASSMLTNFSTVEGQSNTTNLWAKVTTPVPEPTTTFLIGLGAAGFAAVGRRKRG